MTLLEALVLGVVQGLTEFLPISSTAHVRIVPELLGWKDPGAAFTAVIQLGTLLAVLLFFRNEIGKIFWGWIRGLRGGDTAKSIEARFGWAVFYGTIPIVVFGILLKEQIEREFRSLYVIAWTLIGLAILLAFAEWVAKHTRKLDTVKPLDGWIVGLFQALALVPGVSRSGSTITGSLFLGFERPDAAKFSFILSFPAILLAGLFEIYDQRQSLFEVGVWNILLSTLAAFIVGYASIAFLLHFLRRHTTWIFIVYRVLLGIVLIVLLEKGTLTPLR